jgi:hypothetical protein
LLAFLSRLAKTAALVCTQGPKNRDSVTLVMRDTTNARQAKTHVMPVNSEHLKKSETRVINVRLAQRDIIQTRTLVPDASSVVPAFTPKKMVQHRANSALTAFCKRTTA